MYYALHRWSLGERYDVGFANIRIIVATSFFIARLNGINKRLFRTFGNKHL